MGEKVDFIMRSPLCLSASERHAFVCGVVFAVAGAKDRHVTTTFDVYMALRLHLSGSSCCTGRCQLS